MTTVTQAWANVMEDVRSVGKDSRNTQQNFMFRGIDAVMNAVGPALRTHGVVVIPVGSTVTFDTVEIGANRTRMGHVIVDARYRVYGPEGDSIDLAAPGEAMDVGDKAVSKAMSVAYRTLLIQALTLPTDEADPDAVSFERSPGGEPAIANPDPLANARAEVWAVAQRRGYDSPDDLDRSAYAAWSGGATIRDATPDQLGAFLEHLKSQPTQEDQSD